MNLSKKVNRLFLVIAIFYISSSILISLVSPYLPFSFPTPALLILSQALVFLPVLFYLLLTGTSPFQLIRFKKLKPSVILMVILFTFLMMPLITFINAISLLFTTNEVAQLSQDMFKNNFWVNLALMALMPALNEEFVFRGVFYHSYRKTNAIAGAILSGALFGLMHLNLNQFSYALVLGIIFALLVEATGSIFSSMIAHFIVNANSVVLMAFLNWLSHFFARYPGALAELEKIYGQSFDVNTLFTAEITRESLIPAIFSYGVIAFFTTCLAIGVYMWLCNHSNSTNRVKSLFLRGKQESSLEDGEARGNILTPTLFIGIGVCILFMFVEAVLSRI